jgi:hypothetical protein
MPFKSLLISCSFLLFSSLILSTIAQPEPEEGWFWHDAEGNRKTRAELDTILAKHRRWVEWFRGSYLPVFPTDTAHVDLSGADLSWAYLKNANLYMADFEETKLRFADLEGADLFNVDLRRADLYKADLRRAKLIFAQLDSADLLEADLKGADLSTANLRGAYLNGANLYIADLTGANLVGAHLGDADFGGTNLKYTRFEPVSLPQIRDIAYADDLDWIIHLDNPTPMLQLKQSLWDAGFKRQSKMVNTALHRVEASWLEEALFDSTCEWGINPWQPLLILGKLWFWLGVAYIFTLMRTTVDGKYFLGSKKGLNRENQIIPDTWELRIGFFRRIGLAFLFSLERSLRIGFREVSPNHWLKMLLPPEFEFKSRGWPRIVSGVQSLISVALIALSLLSYFGRPFEF